MIYRFSLRWSTYCGLSFLSAIATYYPLARFGSIVLIILYLLYLLADTLKAYSKIRVSGECHDQNEAIIMAIGYNSQHFIFFVIALVLGVYVG